MSNTYNTKINKLINLFHELQSENYKNDELGIQNGFHDFEEKKNYLCDYLINICELLLKHIDSLNNNSIKEAISILEGARSSINQQLVAIDNAVSEGINNNQYPKKRQNVLEAIDKLNQNLTKQLKTLQLELELAELKSKVENENYASSQRKKIEAEVKTIEDSVQEATRMLKVAHNKTVSSTVKDSASKFKSLYDHHSDYEKYWFIAFVVSTALTIAAVVYAFCFETPTTFSLTNLFELLKRVALISLPSIFMKLTLSKYNAERSLRITYAHREKVLDQYTSFDAGIGEDSEAKNAFRIEVARYIFSDPQTNYDNKPKDNNSELNINPIINTVESLANKNRS